MKEIILNIVFFIACGAVTGIIIFSIIDKIRK